MIFFGLLLISFMLATGSTPSLVSYPTMQKLAVLCLVLQLCEFYRQRFYLDPRNEWGFHWRVALLQYAKVAVVPFGSAGRSSRPPRVVYLNS